MSQGSESCLNDVQIEQSPKSNGIDYREVREYKTDFHWVRYYFVTRVNSKYMKSIFNNLLNLMPDILIINSCVWDISRYGPHSMTAYKKNLEKTFLALKNQFWERCRIIWNTALPVASKVKGGFLLPELSYLSNSLNRDVIEGNYYACQLAELHDFDVVDLHYLFKELLHWRASDGIHWKAMAHRRISNILLTHICDSWQIELPRHKMKMFDDVSSDVDPMKKNVNSAPRLMVDKRSNFTELDNLPQYLDFDNIGAIPNPAKRMRPNPIEENKAKRKKINGERIPPLLMPVNRQHLPGPYLPPQPYLPPLQQQRIIPPPLPPQQKVFHPGVLHSMQQFWHLYVNESYDYNRRYAKPYEPRMYRVYPEHPSTRHVPYNYRDIMTNSRMEYMRRQQQRIEYERISSFRYVRVLP
ncbi:uncharacterized protein [Antedon mediterranea]|uniref:uncharacterized protein isoform X2 n=1 Tax=Antedon mediterranea TaxID=105859 RepID=UPI003AF4AA6B